jgi:large subunit ribosomal protein L1
LEILKNNGCAKFDETLEVVLKLGVDPRHSDQMVRGMVALPAGRGKVVKVAVICKDEKIAEANAAGADLAGSENVIELIKSGKFDFNTVIATPDMMGLVGQVARILGPKGLMPNPKLGTVTNDVSEAVKTAKAGQVEYRVEKAGIIHAGVGKLSFNTQDLMTNITAFVGSVAKAKPAASKGTYMKKMYISSTMGLSLKVNLSTVSI